MFELDGKNQDGKKEIRYFNSFDELLEFDKKTGEIRLRNGLTLKDIKFVPKGQKEIRDWEEEPRDFLLDEEEWEVEAPEENFLEQDEEEQDRLFALDMLEDGEEEDTRLITEEDGFLLGSKGNIYNALDEDLIYTRPEQWLHIKGFLNYQVSTFGRVRNIRTGRFLKGRPTNKGYMRVDLCKGDGSKPVPRYIHRLVGEAFIDNPNNLPCINHKDENPSNNCVWNLEWCDYKYNSQYSLHRQEREVEQLDLGTGKVIDTFRSTQDASRVTGTNQGGISLVCNGYMKQSGGYGWRYTKQYKKRKKRPVEQYNLRTGKVIARYNSSNDAARHLDLGDTKVETAARTVKYCCDGLYKSYKGFGFRYC